MKDNSQKETQTDDAASVGCNDLLANFEETCYQRWMNGSPYGEQIKPEWAVHLASIFKNSKKVSEESMLRTMLECETGDPFEKLLQSIFMEGVKTARNEIDDLVWDHGNTESLDKLLEANV